MNPSNHLVVILTLANLASASSVVSSHSGSSSTAVQLERMPQELEKKYALSALPPDLRAGATVLLLDPDKGYGPGKTGSNGFTCIVMRTEWTWPQNSFRDDIFVPLCYDSEGSTKMLPVWLDVAQFRARGWTPKAVYEEVTKRFFSQSYRKPDRTGICYMIAPLMRTYPAPDSTEVMTMAMPHFMFYAPNVKDADIGGKPGGAYPFMVPQGPGAHDVIVLVMGETEKAKVIRESKDLLQELCAYRKELCLDGAMQSH